MRVPESCPRCEYDLRGETQRWTEACPLQGRCPECGLGFDWSDVMNPDRWRSPGLVEHAKGARQFFRWTFTTWWWTLLPWRFWGRVHMHSRVRPGPLLTWLAVMVLVPHILRSGVDAAERITGGYGFSGWQDLSLLEPVARLWGPWNSVPQVEWLFGLWSTGGRWLALAAMLWPVVLCVVPISLHRARVHWRHVLRATVYSAAVPGLFFTNRLVMDVLLAIRRVIGPSVNPVAWYNDLQTISDIGMLVERTIICFGIPWMALWWLFALTRGWKLRRGWIAWALLLALLLVLVVTLSGLEFTIGGRIYRL